MIYTATESVEGEFHMLKSLRTLCLLVLSVVFFLTGCGEQSVLSENVTADTEENESIMAEASSDTDAGQTSDEETSEGEENEDADNADAEAGPETLREPVKVKGIYVTGPIAGIEKMDELITLVEETELNAMVIDVKNDEGKVTYKMQSDTVLEIESGVRYIRDIEALIEKLHEKDIYLIARIVAFKDPYLAEKKPELSLKTESGEVFRDKNGEAWVNPYKKEVWDYLMEIGTQAAEAGFDEIQFDYIRFSTDANADDIDYGEEGLNKTKGEAILEFTQYAYETLHPFGVMVSADVFGTIIDNESDAEIVGQNYAEMAAHLDYICPMVYPSHYINGVYDIDVPDKAPYDTVYHAMCASRDKLGAADVENEANPGMPETNAGTGIWQEMITETEDGIRTAGVRVWIQDFTASWLKDYTSYGAEEVRAQIQAVYDAGYEEWILWNARMNYTEGALLPNWEESAEEPDENTADEGVVDEDESSDADTAADTDEAENANENDATNPDEAENADADIADEPEP